MQVKYLQAVLHYNNSAERERGLVVWVIVQCHNYGSQLIQHASILCTIRCRVCLLPSVTTVSISCNLLIICVYKNEYEKRHVTIRCHCLISTVQQCIIFLPEVGPSVLVVFATTLHHARNLHRRLH